MEIFSLNSGSFALITNFFFLLNLDQIESSELRSHHAVRQRCLSALAAVSVRASVVMESAPVLLDVLSSAHAGDPPSTDSFLELGSEWNSVTTSFFFCFFYPDPDRFSVDEVVRACLSLQRIAERVQDGEDTSRCFHDVIVPRLLSLALQAALQSEGRSFIDARKPRRRCDETEIITVFDRRRVIGSS